MMRLRAIWRICGTTPFCKLAHSDTAGRLPCGSEYTPCAQAQGVSADFWLLGSEMQKSTFAFRSPYVASKSGPKTFWVRASFVVSFGWRQFLCADVAQLVEHVLGRA